MKFVYKGEGIFIKVEVVFLRNRRLRKGRLKQGMFYKKARIFLRTCKFFFTKRNVFFNHGSFLTKIERLLLQKSKFFFKGQGSQGPMQGAQIPILGPRVPRAHAWGPNPKSQMHIYRLPPLPPTPPVFDDLTSRAIDTWSALLIWFISLEILGWMEWTGG